MLAVLGVPQLLSSYFDIRERRREREAADRRWEQEQQRREETERREREEAERRREETQRRREEAQQRREESEQRREESRQRQEERHQEMMTLLAVLVSNTAGQNQGQELGEVVRAQQQIIERLSEENERLRGEKNGEGNGP